MACVRGDDRTQREGSRGGGRDAAQGLAGGPRRGAVGFVRDAVFFWRLSPNWTDFAVEYCLYICSCRYISSGWFLQIVLVGTSV